MRVGVALARCVATRLLLCDFFGVEALWLDIILLYDGLTGLAAAFLFPKIKDLPLGDCLTGDVDLLAGDLEVFRTLFEGVVLLFDCELVRLASLCLALLFFASTFSKASRLADYFAGLGFCSVIFFSELFLVPGAAIIGLARPRLVERGIAEA